MSFAMDPKEFDLPFMRENGFSRKRCKSCGSYFWTQIPDQELCNDSPCVENTFVGNPPTSLRADVNEVRKIFLKFFEDRGHTVIKPYPVVARWRDDLLVTIASIVDFQPYVTNGELPPPANPLVVSQVSLRFEDIDNVGPTAGRHLTIFEMGGAHAFNYPEKFVYWKDETIRYHHELLTKVFGVKSELVNYKEHFWVGGGNAGPDVEASVRGLEISTLVFMQYKCEDSGLVPTRVKTVDTGYGIERWAWLSLGTPTAFHAVYGSSLQRALDMLGVEVEEKVLVEAARLSGAFRVDNPDLFSKSRRLASQRLGMDVKEFERIIKPFEKVTAVLDHVKALVFLLAEGVVPSNVHVGYLARMLLRKSARFLLELDGIDKLIPIIEMQVRHWSPYFPHLKEMEGEVIKLSEIELKKYLRTLEREMENVRRELVSLSSRGIRTVPADRLVMFYESHGIHPTQVAEVAGKLGMEVEAKPDFFASLAESLQAREVKPKVALGFGLERVGIPETRLLYYVDSDLLDFTAKVVHAVDGYVILDQTAFYPVGGGQESDGGFIYWDGSAYEVREVVKEGPYVLHRLDAEIPVGATVRGQVDGRRRAALSLHHTATHIINGAAMRVLGPCVWQTGALKTEEDARLDITYYGHITDEEARRIEEIANDVVRRNIEVEILQMPRNVAESLYGFRLYQGGVVPGKEVRVVKIGDFEVEACGGTHVKKTGDIGFVKIKSIDHIQDGVERIVFVASEQALRYVHYLEGLLRGVSRAINVPYASLLRGVENLVIELDSTRQRIKRLNKVIAAMYLSKVESLSEDIDGVKLLFELHEDFDEETCLAIGNASVAKFENLVYIPIIRSRERMEVIVFSAPKAQALGVNAGEMAKRISEFLGGSGGGSVKFGRGAGRMFKRKEEIKSFVISRIKEVVAR